MRRILAVLFLILPCVPLASAYHRSVKRGERTGPVFGSLFMTCFHLPLTAMAPMKNILPALLAGLLLVPVTALAQEAPPRTITNVTGDVYTFQNGGHVSVFLVTDQGIIASDPINQEAAEWLKRELASRFDQPVKYVVYSHDHADHIGGGEVFDDEAVIIAHERAKATILGENRPTAVPEVVFSDRMSLELGGKIVELVYVGRGHSDNSLVMVFPEERAVFAVDFISVKRMPYQDLSDSYFPDWIDAVKRVEAIDFDILIPGHGPVGTKADATEHREYLEALYEAVLKAAREGQSLEDAKQSIRLDAYSHFGQYEAWLPMNIEGVYRRVSLHRRGN